MNDRFRCLCLVNMMTMLVAILVNRVDLLLDIIGLINIFLDLVIK